MFTLKHLLLWLPMIVLAFANATIRQLVFIKYFTVQQAQQLSTFTLTIFCAVYIWLVFPWLHIQSSAQALLLGFIWAMLTVLFEFGLGLLLKRPMQELLQQYNLPAGQVWPLFLICLLLLPCLIYIIRK